MGKVVEEVQDLRWLEWGWNRQTPGTAGTFYKAYSSFGGKKVYYKLSRFDSQTGEYGHESVNELIADRLMSVLGVPHVSYDLVHADISIGGRIFRTWLCASEDFKNPGESKISVEEYIKANAYPNETPYEFFVRSGWGRYLYEMIAVDYLIINRDRHGANLEILRSARDRSVRPAPLFDNGLSLLFSCRGEEEVRKFDPLRDPPVQSFVCGGTGSLRKNLALIPDGAPVFGGRLEEAGKGRLLEGLGGVLEPALLEKIWETIWTRWKEYERIRSKER